MPGLGDPLAEGRIVGLTGNPALDEGEGEIVVLLALEIERFTAVGRSHAISAFDES
jgi:hypothetical protein